MRVTNFEEVCYGYDLQEAQLEASRCLDCKKPRCVEHCPVSLQIPKFIEQVVKGDFAEAARIIGQDSSLPSVCGRVKWPWWVNQTGDRQVERELAAYKRERAN